MTDPAATLTEAIGRLDDRLLLVVTGAGISRASGIPTFRGPEPEAVWKQEDRSLATRESFLHDPVAQWQWYLRRFERLDQARPNPAHEALAELERLLADRGAGYLLVTQNIDTLHEQAGSTRLIKVHGTSDRLRCSRYGCRHGAPEGSLPRDRFDLRPFVESPARERLPTCPECGSLLRAHVLFFDEYYQEHRDYHFDQVQEACGEAAILVFVGTSLSVGVTDLALHAALRRGAPVYSIDPHAAAPPAWMAIRPLAAPAETLLPEVCRRLAAADGPAADT